MFPLRRKAHYLHGSFSVASSLVLFFDLRLQLKLSLSVELVSRGGVGHTLEGGVEAKVEKAALRWYFAANPGLASDRRLVVLQLPHSPVIASFRIIAFDSAAEDEAVIHRLHVLAQTQVGPHCDNWSNLARGDVLVLRHGQDQGGLGQRLSTLFRQI